MEKIVKEDLLSSIDEYRQRIADGAVFIYPTDTIYGIGCDARNEKAVMKIKAMKQRYKPLSVIAPSKEWILDNFIIPVKHRHWLDKLPGKYTLIFEMKDSNKDSVLPLAVSGSKKIGIRIPAHWISEFVGKIGFPIVSTSVNRAGMEPLTCFEDLSKPNFEGFSECDFFVDEGTVERSRSSVVDLTSEREVYYRM